MIFRRKPRPDLIDIQEYVAGLLEQREKGLPYCPPRPIPHVMGRDWTDEEWAMMEKNRRIATEIYGMFLEGRESAPPAKESEGHSADG